MRNGVKMSGVVRLPEVLCIHLKRFRHELMFSAKVAARVAFPLHDLNMAPYLHKGKNTVNEKREKEIRDRCSFFLFLTLLPSTLFYYLYGR